MFKQAAQIIEAHRRKTSPFRLGHKHVAARARIDQRLMQMPAARIKALDAGPRHEGCEMAHAPADLSRRRAENEHVIGGGERVARRECALHLTRSPFVFDRAQRQTKRLIAIGERAQHRLHQIHVGFRMIMIPGLNGGCGDGLSRFKGLERLAQQLARREMKRSPIVEIFVAENPPRARRPWQNAKGRGIWNDGDVRRACHLVQPHAAAAHEG